LHETLEACTENGYQLVDIACRIKVVQELHLFAIEIFAAKILM
jgi:hypothetical protein